MLPKQKSSHEEGGEAQIIHPLNNYKTKQAKAKTKNSTREKTENKKTTVATQQQILCPEIKRRRTEREGREEKEEGEKKTNRKRRTRRTRR